MVVVLGRGVIIEGRRFRAHGSSSGSRVRGARSVLPQSAGIRSQVVGCRVSVLWFMGLGSRAPGVGPNYLPYSTLPYSTLPYPALRQTPNSKPTRTGMPLYASSRSDAPPPSTTSSTPAGYTPAPAAEASPAPIPTADALVGGARVPATSIPLATCVSGLGCEVWGVGCGVWGVGCGVWGVGFGVWGLGCGVWGVGFGVSGLGCGLSGPRFRISEVEFEVSGLGGSTVEGAISSKPSTLNPKPFSLSLPLVFSLSLFLSLALSFALSLATFPAVRTGGACALTTDRIVRDVRGSAARPSHAASFAAAERFPSRGS